MLIKPAESSIDLASSIANDLILGNEVITVCGSFKLNKTFFCYKKYIGLMQLQSYFGCAKSLEALTVNYVGIYEVRLMTFGI